jgi:hypothetical protein
MIECDYLLVGTYAFFDRGNSPCLIGIFDALAARALPVVMPTMATIARVVGDPDQRFSYELSVVHHDGDVIPIQRSTAAIGPNGAYNLIAMFLEPHFPKLGVYSVQLNVDGRLVASRTFDIRRA